MFVDILVKIGNTAVRKYKSLDKRKIKKRTVGKSKGKTFIPFAVVVPLPLTTYKWITVLHKKESSKNIMYV